MELNEHIKQIAENLDCLYLRAIPSDANERVELIPLKNNTLIIYSNHPVVSYDVDPIIKAIYPLEIQVLELADVDDNTEDSDLIINRCRKIAEKMAVEIMAFDPAAILPDNFEVDPFDTVQVHDDILTGVSLSIEIGFQLICE